MKDKHALQEMIDETMRERRESARKFDVSGIYGYFLPFIPLYGEDLPRMHSYCLDHGYTPITNTEYNINTARPEWQFLAVFVYAGLVSEHDFTLFIDTKEAYSPVDFHDMCMDTDDCSMIFHHNGENLSTLVVDSAQFPPHIVAETLRVFNYMGKHEVANIPFTDMVQIAVDYLAEHPGVWEEIFHDAP